MISIHNPCILIPVYNHGSTTENVVDALASTDLPVILVDDGSREDTRKVLEEISRLKEQCSLVVLKKNTGKGGAVIAGLKTAKEMGFTHVLQVDADGQHDLDCAASFLSASKKAPKALIAGQPVYDDSAPASRIAGRKITNFWVMLETLSRDIPDAMCGFRVYPVGKTLKALIAIYVDKRMGFDIEVLVRLHWLGVPMEFYPVKVDYPEGGVSNFRMVRDNIGISLSHTKLFFGMLLRLPYLAIRSIFRNRGSYEQQSLD